MSEERDNLAAVEPTREAALALVTRSRLNLATEVVRLRGSEDRLKADIEAAYREGFSDSALYEDESSDACWLRSNTRAALSTDSRDS